MSVLESPRPLHRVESRGIALALALAGVGVALTSVALQAALDDPSIARSLTQDRGAMFATSIRVNLLTLFVLGALVTCAATWNRAVPGAAPSATAVVTLFAVATGVRVVAALGFALYGIAHYGAPIVWDDEMAFHEGAVEIARVLQQGGGTLSSKYQHLAGHYLDLLGSFYALLGPRFLIARFFNVLFGVATVALTYDILRRMFDGRHALLGAWVVALWPTYVIWNGSGLRDTLAVLVALLMPWLLTRWPVRPTPTRWVALVVTGTLSILVLNALRQHAALAAVSALVVALLFVSLSGRTARARGVVLVAILSTALALILILSGAFGPGASKYLAQFSPRALEYRTAVSLLGPMLEYAPGVIPRRPDANFLHYGQLVRIIPPGGSTLVTAAIAGFQTEPRGYQVITDRGATHVLAEEFVQPLSDENVGWGAPVGRIVDGMALLFLPVPPWENAPLQYLLTAPDTVLFMGLWVLAVYGVWRERRRLRAPQVMLFVYLALLLLGLSLVSTNIGTVVRHRSMLIPALVVLATPSMVVLLKRLERRHAPLPSSRMAPSE